MSKIGQSILKGYVNELQGGYDDNDYQDYDENLQGGYDYDDYQEGGYDYDNNQQYDDDDSDY